MTDRVVTFTRDLGESVIVTASGGAGKVKALQVAEDGSLLYYVRSTTGAADAWARSNELIDPAASTVITSLEYFNLFTADERTAIITSDIPQVKVAVALASAAGTLDLANPIVTSGIDQLVTLGLITADRAARIKTGQPPVAPPAAPPSPPPAA